LVQQWYEEHGFKPKILDSKYFEQNLLIQYQRKYTRIPGLIREPREELVEPHTEKKVPIGTLDVEAYKFPAYVYEDILVIEKKGLKPVWESVRLAERFDLAMVHGEGQPSEALRTLLERAESEGYKGRILAGHDCDHSGYIIAHTMSEETERMLGYKVDIIDLGLKVADAIRLGLPHESYIRSADLPQWMIPAPGYRSDDPDEDWEEEWQGLPGDWKEPDTEADKANGIMHLSRDETRWFVGKRIPGNEGKPTAGNESESKPKYLCIRVELNAMPVPVMVRFFEDQLVAHGAGDKLMPPQDVIDTEAQKAHGDAVTEWVTAAIRDILGLDGIINVLTGETADDVLARKFRPRGGRPKNWIETAYKQDRGTYWRDAISEEVDKRVQIKDPQLRPRLIELMKQALGMEGEGAED
jgi:hypothetical protein